MDELIYINNLNVDHIYFTVQTFEIQVEGLGNSDAFTGKTLYCKCINAGKLVAAEWALTSGYQYATINQNGRIDINSGVQNKTLIISCMFNGTTETKTLYVTYSNQFLIESSDTIYGTSGTVVARFNQAAVTPTWSITSGGSCASIDADGNLSISQSGDITVLAEYYGYTATRNIRVEYVANTTSETLIGEDGSVTTRTSTVTENQDGTTTT